MEELDKLCINEASEQCPCEIEEKCPFLKVLVSLRERGLVNGNSKKGWGLTELGVKVAKRLKARSNEMNVDVT